MSDIRDVCKVFLDFVYNNPVLPESIKEALEKPYNNEVRKWDIRIVAKILHWNKGLRGDKNNEDIAWLITDGNLFDSIPAKLSRWLMQNNHRFNYIINECNQFFHDVSKSDNNTFISVIRDIIADAPDGWKKDEYMEEISFITDDGEAVNEIDEDRGEKVSNTVRGHNCYSDEDREKMYKIAYCFCRYGHEVLYPVKNQGDAFEAAATVFGMPKNTLRNYRDDFDFYYPESGRRGWVDKKLSEGQMNVKNKFDRKSKDEVILECKKILGIIS